jgi:methyltransferase-like protein/SAM-dependent methyltransferase
MQVAVSAPAVDRPLDEISQALRASYEAVPYFSKPIDVTHPDALAAAAILHGRAPAPVASCRVLELGCASGGNLLPMAVALPGSSFVGVDLTPGQIEKGRATIAAVGLKNIRLEAMSIADIDDDFGIFDYIICHGVYSWVPAAVQDAILRICARNLAPQGVAYVSYNTLPGWHLAGIARDFMLFHDRPSLPPDERLARGRAAMELVAAAAAPGETPYSGALERARDHMRKADNSYLLHELFEPVNAPVYFAEFMRRAAGHELQLLCESGDEGWKGSIPAEVRATLTDWARDPVEYGQYLDFLRGRRFRRTLLCHADGTSPAIAIEHLRRLHLSAEWRAPDADELETTTADAFVTPEGMAVTTRDAVVCTALRVLDETRPGTLTFDELLHRVRGELDAARGEAGEPTVMHDDLATPMLHAAAVGLVGLHAGSARCATEVTERPLATALARFQAAESDAVTSLRHEMIRMPPEVRVMIRHLDGTNDREALCRLLSAAVSRGEIALDDDDASSPDAVAKHVDAMLLELRKRAILAG